MFLLDGQHRIEALRQIYNDSLNKDLDIIVIKFTTLKEMKNYFADINNNSNIEPIYTYFDNELIQNIIISFKFWLKLNYQKSFKNKKTDDNININMTLDNFIGLFLPYLVKNLYDKYNKEYNSIDLLVERLDITNKFVKYLY